MFWAKRFVFRVKVKMVIALTNATLYNTALRKMLLSMITHHQN
jgi:hypothetical protein